MSARHGRAAATSPPHHLATAPPRHLTTSPRRHLATSPPRRRRSATSPVRSRRRTQRQRQTLRVRRLRRSKRGLTTASPSPVRRTTLTAVRVGQAVAVVMVVAHRPASSAQTMALPHWQSTAAVCGRNRRIDDPGLAEASAGDGVQGHGATSGRCGPRPYTEVG